MLAGRTFFSAGIRLRFSLSRRHLIRLPAGLAVAGAAGRTIAREPDQSARDVLARLIGPRAGDFNFHLDTIPAARPWHHTIARGGRVRIEGSDPVALTRGAYDFLKRTGAASMSWEGDRIALPARFADLDSGRIESPFRHRAYLNPCTYGYTTPWWNWRRWEREIDWMALHGIDMPLALEGQEYVWRALWREAGLTDAQLAGHFSAAPFIPWERMGNIEGYMAPLSPAWIDRKRDLQIRILDRMRSLGMKPVLPAFAGYVPAAFAETHPEARLYRMRSWESFPGTYWLDPADPLFAQLAGRFLSLYGATYGDGDFYLADSFNETLPPLTDDGSDVRDAHYGDATANHGTAAAPVVSPEQRDSRLATYGRALYDSIRQSRPDATWVMQGWLFGADRNFWSAEAIGAFLSRVPDNKLLVLDIGNDRYPDVWSRAQAFHGKHWIYGYVHNYGGSNPVYGDLDFYQRDLKALTERGDTGNLCGFGVFPEGLHATSVVYEYLYDLAWGDLGKSPADWLPAYLAARYGAVTPALIEGWSDLIAGCLRTRYWTPRWWRGEAGAYLLFKRPRLDLAEFEGHPGDHAALDRAVRRLTALAGAYPDGSLLQYDLIDAARHLASIEIDTILQRTLTAYGQGDLAAGDQARQKAASLVSAVDALIGTQQESLASWTNDAAASAGDPAEARDFVRQARLQITVWGGSGGLHDYASKAWQGLYSGFYLPRWTLFLDELRRATDSGAAFDQPAVTARLAAWEHDWANRDETERRLRPADPVQAVRDLLSHLGQT
jgi:alpha-N-acetylglucosaminidase